MRLASAIRDRTGICIDSDAMFDVQIKRIHEYKRQLLHVLGVVDEYLRIVQDGEPLQFRASIFSPVKPRPDTSSPS